MRSTFHLSLFLIIACSIIFGLHFYIWARLIRDTGLKNPWRWMATLVLVVLALSIPTGLILTRSAVRFALEPFLWAVYTWLGAAFFCAVLLAAVDLLKLMTVTIPLAIQRKPLNAERRQFLAMMTGGVVLLADLGLSLTALWNAGTSAVQIKRVRVSLSKLPPALEGYRLVQISDVHVGPLIHGDFVRTIVSEINALKPDLIAITGDLVDGTVAQLQSQLGSLRDLKAKNGVFFVTGNHEYYTDDVDGWLAWLTGIGIRPLRNERVTIRKGFDLAGTDDFNARGKGHGQNIPQALANRKTDRPVILMAHQPRSFFEAQSLGVDLQLSGHTHGGQLFPFSFIVSLVQPYIAGLYRKGNSQIYVSRGTGYWGPPMRLGSPAEITEITLSAAQGESV